MCSTSVFTSIMTMILKFMIIFIISVFIFTSFLQMWQFILLKYDLCSSFVNGIVFFFSKLFIFIVSSLNDSEDYFMKSPLYTSCLSSLPSNVHIVDIEYPQEICSPIFVVNDFSGLILH